MILLAEQSFEGAFCATESKSFGDNPFLGETCCVLKKCCEKYKRKGKHCKKCPKK